MQAWDKWLGRSLAAALAAVTLVLRLIHLDTRPLWLDEAWSHWFSGLGWHTLLDSVIRYDTHPPLYYSALKVWRGVAGDSQLALRSLSVLASAATLVLVLALARKIRVKESQWHAMIAALALASLSPPLIETARQARPYALLILSFAAGLFAILSLARKWREGGEEPSWRLWAIYGIAIECTLWLHTLGALHAFALFLALSFALWTFGITQKRLVPFVSTHLLAGFLWLPTAAILVEQQKTWAGATWLKFRMELVPAELIRAIAGPGLAGIALILLALAGVYVAARNRDQRTPALMLLIAAIVPGAMEILLSHAITPIFLGRTLTPGAVPVILLAIMPLAYARRSTVPIVATSLVGGFMFAASWQMATQRPEERWKDVGATLTRHIGPGDEIWLLPNELLLPFRLANPSLARTIAIKPLPYGFPARLDDGPHPSGTAAVTAITPKTARAIVADARRRGVKTAWVIMRFPWLFDPDAALRTSLGPDALVDRSSAFAPLLIYQYRVTAPAAPAGEAVAR